MTKRDLAAIGVRLLAILAVLYAVSSLSFSLGNTLARGGLRNGPGTTGGVLSTLLAGSIEQVVVVVGPFLALCCLSVMLWLFADAFALFVAGREEREGAPLQVALSPQDALTVALLVLGVYLLVTGVPPLVNYAGYWLLTASQPSGFRSFEADVFMMQTLGEVVRTALGLLLIVGTRGIAASIPAMRALMSDPASAARRAWHGPQEPREPDADL